MGLPAHVTVLWWGDVCLTKRCDLPVLVGEDGDCTIALPCPRTKLAVGDHVLGAFEVRVRDIERGERVVAAKVWPRHLVWTVASGALHAVLLAVAFFFALRDPPASEAERIDQMRGYLSRIAEQPRDPDSIESTRVAEEQSDDRAGTSGDGAVLALRAPATPSHAAPVKPAPSTKAHRVGRRGGGSGATSGAPSCAAYARAKHEPNEAWIEFVLTDTDNRPVRGEPYRVTLPDGTVREGKTDERGLVCFTGVKPGNAQIEWPRLGHAARYMGANDDPI